MELYVFQGLVRMGVLRRLRYVLEVMRPAAPVVRHVLQVLTRVARHSINMAYQVRRAGTR